jgi:hypothetical protein
MQRKKKKKNETLPVPRRTPSEERGAGRAGHARNVEM